MLDEDLAELDEIDWLCDEGHSHHCACRQVWGDGECECHTYVQGYDPYAWMQGSWPVKMLIRHRKEICNNEASNKFIPASQ